MIIESKDVIKWMELNVGLFLVTNRRPDVDERTAQHLIMSFTLIRSKNPIALFSSICLFFSQTIFNHALLILIKDEQCKKIISAHQFPEYSNENHFL